MSILFFLSSSRKSAAESFANQTLKVTDVQKNYFQVIQKIYVTERDRVFEIGRIVFLESCLGHFGEIEKAF